jgi:putative hydrolase of the HAD superfamily
MIVKGVTFDLWLTLFCMRDYSEYRINLLSQFLAKEGFPKDRNLIEEQYIAAEDIYTNTWKKKQRHVSGPERIKYILRNLDIKLLYESKRILTRKLEEAIFSDPPPLIKDAETVLKSLYKKYRIGLICDSGFTPGRILRQVLKNHNVLKYFKCTLFSDEVGRTKPHSIIFKKAVENFKAKEKEVMHVGDLLDTDIAGAKAAGMKTVWFNREEKKIKSSIKFKPDYEIKKLPELLEILEL